MKKSILNIGNALNKSEQKKINGSGGCDIAPPGCPCIVPPGHPCLDNDDGNGGNNNTGTCFTLSGPIQVPCNQSCPDGSQPLCL